MSKKAIIMIFVGIIFVGVLVYLIINAQKTETNLSTKELSTKNQLVNTAIISTNYGDITIEFLQDKAPATVNNFIELAKSGFYNGTKFHRVIKDFMIQGGDPLSKGADTSLYGRGGPGYTFADEINDSPMVRGMVAMANSGPNTNGSQFFIITAASTPWLQGKHTVFAQVTVGMDIVDAIQNVQTGANDLPVAPVVINQITLN